jgi:uncharacterized protein YfeS
VFCCSRATILILEIPFELYTFNDTNRIRHAITGRNIRRRPLYIIMRTLTAIISLWMLTACGEARSKKVTVIAPSSVDSIQSATTIMNNIYPSLENAHPNTRVLMNDEWYYSPIDDMAPFGSDDAADTYAYFYEWRQTNKKASIKKIILNHFLHWGYPQSDLETTDYEKFTPFLEQNELGDRLLFGMDAAIIAAAIGQLYLEGKIDPDIKAFARTAIKRELQPQILITWNDLKPMREKRLNDFIYILDNSQ